MSEPVSTVPLGEVAEFVRGITFKPEDVVPNGTPNAVACMRTKNVQSDLDTTDVWSVDRRFVKRPDQYLRAGDTLVSSANSWNLVGKCSWIPALEYRATFGGFVSVLRAANPALDSRYLYRWFSSSRMQATIRSFGRQTTNISNLDIRRCLHLDIPLPSIEEQQRIASVLDQLDALRVKRRGAIAQIDELTQSIFLDMFGDPVSNPGGWPAYSMLDCCSPYSGGTPSKSNSEYWEGRLPWFSPKDLKATDLFDSIDHISEAVPRSTTLKLLPKDTVVIVVRGMILAHTVPIGVLRVPATINQDLKALIPRESIDPQFLAACLRAQHEFILQQVSTAAHGTKRLDSEALARIQILVPPVPLQQEFARRVGVVERLKHSHCSHLAELDALFASLQSRAFRGAL